MHNKCKPTDESRSKGDRYQLSSHLEAAMYKIKMAYGKLIMIGYLSQNARNINQKLSPTAPKERRVYDTLHMCCYAR